MKEETVKILSISVYPYKYYQSNGSLYKDEVETTKVFGIGDDNQVYTWDTHSFWLDEKYGNEKILGWKLYKPK